MELTAIGGIQHSTGNGNDSAKNNYQYFDSGERGANAHFFIDADNILQFVETNQRAGHARSPANSMFWGCEMCETRDKEKFRKIWDNQVWLWSYLFRTIRITQVSKWNLRSHAEENAINHVGDHNNHTDPDAYFSKFGKTMQDMRDDVQKMLNIAIMPTLRFGAKGEAVSHLQHCLQGAGYELGNVDGVFGQKTKGAVVRFQQDHKIGVDGIVGTVTWGRLIKL